MSTPALAEHLPRPGRVPLVEVIVTEPIDALTVPRLRELLEQTLAIEPEHLVVDLVNCPMIDASGIDALLATHRRAMRAGAQLTLRAPVAGVYRNLQLAHAAQVLHIVRAPQTLAAEDWCAAAATGTVVDPRPAPQ